MNNISTNKTETKKALKRKAIIKAAAKIFSEKGYINSSIKNITDEASMAVGSFYSYFENKEEVLAEIYQEIFNMSVKAASNVPRNSSDSVAKRFTQAMTRAVWTYARNKELSSIMLIKAIGINDLLEKKRLEILDKTNEYLKSVLIHLNEDHSVKINDINMTSVLLTNSIFGAITYWIDDKSEISLENMLFSLCVYHLSALNITFIESEVKEYIIEMLSLNYEKIS